MTNYKAPLRDMHFAMNELLDFPAHYASLPGCEEATPDLVSAILEEGAKFASQVIAPLDRDADEVGCTWNNGEVTTSPGFKEAWQQFLDAGWMGLNKPVEYGGQGLPKSLNTAFEEMMITACVPFSFHPCTIEGALATLGAWGSEEQKSNYIPKLASGQWLSAMGITESNCGSDLGLMRSKAEPNADGSYRITGTKIFISQGEHDMSDNIVHMVLARLPDAPAGTKGISLFIVPKFLLNDAGEAGERNAVHCGSLEHKMGLHGSPTCVMNYDGATGYLLGPANRGLNCMFSFLNSARLGVAQQGMTHAEFGFQKSLAYAKDRLQGRSLTGPKNPDGPADPLIVHPDVRRLLLTQKCYAEGGRAFIFYLAQMLDIVEKSQDEAARKQADGLLGLLTPIAKAFLTETGFESANMALQCLGAHGYVREWRVEQNVRDSRVACIYEGSTVIQALDLINRKILMNNSENLGVFTNQIRDFCEANKDIQAVSELLDVLCGYCDEWHQLATQVGAAAADDADELGAAAVDFMMYSGYLVLGYFWARSAVAAQQALDNGASEEDFYSAKIKTANFYFKRVLPRSRGHVAALAGGAEPLMALDEEHFVF